MKTSLLLLFFFFSSLSQANMYPEDIAPGLKAMAIAFENDLNAGSSKVKIKFSGESGTSAYVKFKYTLEDGQVIRGAVLPHAEATAVLGEIASYKLSRMLGVDSNYSAKTLIKVKGKGLQVIKTEIKKLQKAIRGKRGLKTKKANAKNVITMIERDQVLWCAFAPWGSRPYTWARLTNFKHPLWKSIKANKKSPESLSPEKVRTFGSGEYPSKGNINPSVLAEDLSNMMVIDTLMGQYDRFSGGNLQYLINDQNNVRLGVYDNGGTFEWSSNRLKVFKKKVSRFSPEVKSNIIALNSFLQNQSSKFKNFASPQEVKKELELINQGPTFKKQVRNPEYVWKKFKFTLNEIAKHIQKSCKRYGQSCLF
jgi:hypothetical protein